MGCGELVAIAHGNLRMCKRLRTSYRHESVGMGAGVHGNDEVDRRALEDTVVEMEALVALVALVAATAVATEGAEKADKKTTRPFTLSQ